METVTEIAAETGQGTGMGQQGQPGERDGLRVAETQQGDKGRDRDRDRDRAGIGDGCKSRTGQTSESLTDIRSLRELERAQRQGPPLRPK